MARLTIVEDDAALLATLVETCEAAGHSVESAANGRVALERIATSTVDLVLTDVNMPELDGFSLCRQLREMGFRAPILILTSRDSEIDEVLGLDLGADDYLAKPISSRVLLARINALLRRNRTEEQEDSSDELLVRGNLWLNLSRLEAHFHGTRLEVTVTEVRLLEAMLRRPGRVLSREQLLKLARQDDSVVDPRLADTYIARLRRKMKEIEPSVSLIETVIGAGYRLSDD